MTDTSLTETPCFAVKPLSLAQQLKAAQKAAQQTPLITIELSPPKGTDTSLLLKRAHALKGLVAAINVPDCQRALLRMSSLVTASLIEREVGLATIWQLTCRDRNLIALQADLLGAIAMGLSTLLALTGDPVQVGDQKAVAQHVFHTEAVGLLRLVQQLNGGHDAVGQTFPKGGTNFLTGAALNPAALQRPAQRNRLCHKLEAGARFFQTQPVYTQQHINEVWEAVHWATNQVGCALPAVFIGLVPPKNAKTARFLNVSVPGISIPNNWIEALEAEEASQKLCGSLAETLSISLCCELAANTAKQSKQHWHLMPVQLEKHAVAFVQQLLQHLSITPPQCRI